MSPQPDQTSAPAVQTRRRWRATGQVQGVGFRPFVYRIATELGLTGFVLNDTAGVVIEAQGETARLDEFAVALNQRRPALATIASLVCRDISPQSCERGFEIRHSAADEAASAQVTVDTAVCPDCIAELCNDRDRRHGYGLINCTNCGPRYSIVQRIPYDRPNTTMSLFAMCAECSAEYTNPADRRFHAQPIACHACGPKVTLADNTGSLIDGPPIEQSVARLLAGQILAVKGLGGFHLAVRADDPRAVFRLRRLKQRDQKPFAIMCRDIAEAQRLVTLSDTAISAMLSPACPIILAPRRPDSGIAPEVAPASHRLGVVLPYTPIQHQLFRFRSGAIPPLVMTSANLTDEPLVIDNSEAVQRLGSICDALLWHDRPIERPVDDSVLIDMGNGHDLLPIRRARGYVPSPIPLPTTPREPGLCLGGELKNTIAVVRDGAAILSHHMGDLTHSQAYAYFRRAISDMCELFAVRPRWIAHDLHPQYLSTAAARQLADKLGIRLIAIQHHHAHAAAVLAEHGRTEPALVLVCDGVGYGADGAIWGGELLLADLKSFQRVAHFAPIRLPGGDAAAKDGRRCGLALLHQAFGDDFADHPQARRLVSDDAERAMLAGMIRSGFQCIASSGAGRVFDGVAALLGVCTRNSYEAEAPMRLESAAAGVPMCFDEELFRIDAGEDATVDLSPLIRSLVQRLDEPRPVEELAALFHDQFVRAWEQAIVSAAERSGVNCVALSGGVFCNQRLTEGMLDRLGRRGMRVLRHRLVPPNDGGLAFGQAAVASSTIG